jgi:acetyl-CoA carboxylase carboxyl transferase subunit beta
MHGPRTGWEAGKAGKRPKRVNWINNVVRPKIRSFLTTKREVPDNLWVKCPETGQMVFYKDLEANQFVVPGSNYHMRMASDARLAGLFDEGEYTKVEVPSVPQDPLKFRDGKKRYTDRLREAKTETNLDDAVLVGEGKLDGLTVVAAAQDFRFMAGSLGMAAGEAVVAGMLHACEKNAPFILFAASGGARMQEGILSLMQMPRTTIAVQKLRDAGLPYIVVLTDPTTGGVTASYAMLGDIHIAEPGALICFAGPRVIQQTIREQLPEGFQRAEYLLAHGMIDMVVHRHKLRETLARICNFLMVPQAAAKSAVHGKGKKLNGQPYVNGNAVESNLIEGGKKEPIDTAIEPEVLGPEERFDATRLEQREGSRKDDDGSTKRSV